MSSSNAATKCVSVLLLPGLPVPFVVRSSDPCTFLGRSCQCARGSVPDWPSGPCGHGPGASYAAACCGCAVGGDGGVIGSETGALAQNLALNIAEKGFSISVFNRTYEKTEAAVRRAQKEGEEIVTMHMCSCPPTSRPPAPTQTTAHWPFPGLGSKLTGYQDMKDFVVSLQKPRCVGGWKRGCPRQVIQ